MIVRLDQLIRAPRKCASMQMSGKKCSLKDFWWLNRAADPPVPIPNTEVKCCIANGSRTQGSARVGRCQETTPLLVIYFHGEGFLP